MTCPICGSGDGCNFTSGYMADEPLTADDWRRIYYFIRYVQLPFLHGITARARARNASVKPPLLRASDIVRYYVQSRVFKRVKCDVCGEEVAANWIVRHLKNKHGEGH